jgi:hypothetical protein
MGVLADPLAQVGAAFGRRYAVERELGRGGMGTVYLAHDRKHGRQVAIKVLPPALAAALGPDRFLREIRIAARLNHPHILSLHDSGASGGTLFYVMPYVEGQSLRDRLRQDMRLPVPEALDIARQVADALDYAHAAGIVHRDVKPENILLAGQHALLADFGLAKAGASGSMGRDGSKGELHTDTGLPIGTAAYASPEQAAGTRDLDGRSDIYSLGCVLYEMLVGDPPEARMTASRILERRFAVPPPPAGSLRPEAPPWVDDALARAIAANPADRYSRAADFRDALAGPRPEAASAPPMTPGPQRARMRRRQLLWMGAGAVALALVVAAAAFLPRRALHVDPKGVVVAGFENRTGDSTLAPISDIATDYIARGLANTGLMHAVYDIRTTAREAGEPVRIGPAAGLALARRVGAGTVLWGSYYLQGDTLHFEAQLLDATSGMLITPLEPTVGPLLDKTRVVDALRQRVMAGLAVALGAELESWKVASLPPTYEAYQEMLAAGQTGFDFAAAVEHYRRAAALDTSFTGAPTAAAVMLWLLDDCPAVDSIARRLASSRSMLPPADRGQLDLASASCGGDPTGALRAIRAALASAPRSVYFTVLGAVVALENLRPREALEILSMLDAERIGLSGERLSLYRDWLRMTYHMLGDYRRELAVAEKEASGDSRSAAVAGALAGLGRAPEAERAALALLPEHHSGDDPWPGPLATECVALELRAHGLAEAAQRVLDREMDWYGPAGRTEAPPDNFPCLEHLFSVTYYGGHWDEARTGYQHLLAHDSMSVKAHAALGALAVRRGDLAEAARMDAWLAGRESSAHAGLARARLAALRGDRAQAVALLRQAYDRRLRGRMFLHLDPDFESLRDDPAYRELVRPKG